MDVPAHHQPRHMETGMSINTYLMDCMDFMKSKPKGHYQLAIVDPPYM